MAPGPSRPCARSVKAWRQTPAVDLCFPLRPQRAAAPCGRSRFRAADGGVSLGVYFAWLTATVSRATCVPPLRRCGHALPKGEPACEYACAPPSVSKEPNMNPFSFRTVSHVLIEAGVARRLGEVLAQRF